MSSVVVSVFRLTIGGTVRLQADRPLSRASIRLLDAGGAGDKDLPVMRLTIFIAVLAATALVSGQNRRSASPAGASATEIGGRYDARTGFVGGSRLEVSYGRPIKRGRDLFGPPD